MRIASLLKLFLVGTLVALLIRFLFVENYRIASDSMLPNLLTGDHVLVNKLAYNIRLPFSAYELVKFARPKRGDVIAFTLPDQGIETFVKRVIALEGERVEIKNGKLFLNEKPVPHEPATQLPIPLGDGVLDDAIIKTLEWEIQSDGEKFLISRDLETAEHYGPVEVPKDHIFVMGDNRSSSVDSRSWGPVPFSCLKGRVRFIWFSSGRDGNFRRQRTGIGIGP